MSEKIEKDKRPKIKFKKEIIHNDGLFTQRHLTTIYAKLIPN